MIQILNILDFKKFIIMIKKLSTKEINLIKKLKLLTIKIAKEKKINENDIMIKFNGDWIWIYVAVGKSEPKFKILDEIHFKNKYYE